MKANRFKIGPKIIFSIVITFFCFSIVFLYKIYSTKAESFVTTEPDTDNPQLNFIGAYKDQVNSDGCRNMYFPGYKPGKDCNYSSDSYHLPNSTGWDQDEFSKCKEYASKNGYSYYSIQFAGGGNQSNDNGICLVTNDLSHATRNGLRNGNEGWRMGNTINQVVGGGDTNAIYSTNTTYTDNYTLLGPNGGTGGAGNTEYPENNIAGSPFGYNHKQCADACTNNANCVGFVTDSKLNSYNGRKCWLKTKLDSSKSRSDSSRQTYRKDPINNFQYLGCFNDNRSRMLPSSMGDYKVEDCLNIAKQNSATYDLVGMQYSDKNNVQCFLGKKSDKKFDTLGNATNCKLSNVTASGNQYTVGDWWSNAVYEIPKS